jgi:hypothetical protein
MSVQRSNEHVVGEIAQLQVAEALTRTACVVKPVIPDYGEVFGLEIPYDGRLFGIFVLLQVKGTRSPHKLSKEKVALANIRLDTLNKWVWSIQHRKLRGFFGHCERLRLITPRFFYSLRLRTRL